MGSSMSTCACGDGKDGMELVGPAPRPGQAGPAGKEREYPMWVLPMSTFLEMSGAPPGHQTLRKKGLLVQWTPDMFVIFVSHQWVAHRHPDPKGLQQQVLREALLAIIAKKLLVGADLTGEIVTATPLTMSQDTVAKLQGAYVWYDYWSVPQPSLSEPGEEADTVKDMIGTVRTIPSYVARADIFIGLCPELKHEDTGVQCSYRSWLARGWCRLEMACRGLRSSVPNASSILLVFTPTAVQLKSSYAWLTAPVGEGEFSVDSDRELLRPVVAGLVDSYLASTRVPGATGTLIAKRRFVEASRDFLLSGLPLAPAKPDAGDSTEVAAAAAAGEAEEEEEVVAFLERHQFRSLLDAGEAGLSPLHIAAVENRPRVVALAVAMGADVNAGATESIMDLFVPAGAAPLYLACNHGNAKAARCLLRLKADPAVDNAFFIKPMHVTSSWTAISGMRRYLNTLEVLLDFGIDPNQKMEGLGLTALATTTAGSHPEAAELLLSRGADVCADGNLCGMLHQFSMWDGGSPELVALFVKHGANVNEPAMPHGLALRAVLMTKRLVMCLGSGTSSSKVLAELEGSTPLALSALMGRRDLCEALLKAKADPTPRNARGRTALDLAISERHGHVVELLQPKVAPGGAAPAP